MNAAPGALANLGSLHLSVEAGENAGASFDLPVDGRRISIGRSASNEFVLPHDNTVSRWHAVVEVSPAGYRVRRHEKASTPVLRGGREIPESGALVVDGDRIQLGHTTIRVAVEAVREEPPDDDRTAVFQLDPPPPPPPPPPAATGAAAPPPPPPPAARETSARRETPAPPPRKARPSPQRVVERFGRFDVVQVLDAAGDVSLARGTDGGGGDALLLRRLPAAGLGFFGRRRFKAACGQARALADETVLAPREVGQEGAVLWITYPPVRGVTAARVRAVAGNGLPMAAAVHVAHEVARALDHVASALGARVRPTLTDRDVVCTSSGRVVLCFAPPAPAFDDDRYRSPEEEGGRSGDARSAIFSAGVLLYELLAGEPIAAAQKATLRSIDMLRIHVPDVVASATMRALEVRPEDRFATAGDLVHELSRAARAFDADGAAELVRCLQANFPDVEGPTDG